LPDLTSIIERYKPRLDSLGMRLYNSEPWEDTALLKWWLTLNETGEITRLINPDGRKLRAFFEIFKPPTALLYTLASVNGDGIDSAAWFTPVDHTSTHRAAYTGLYHAHPSTRTALSFTALAYSLAFEFYSAFINTTWQPDLLDEHTKLGYTTVGCIPYLYDQPFCYIVHLTRDSFMQSRFMQITERIEK